ncbi:hypothetical protein ACUL41_18055 [Virgibacillus natechei]
MSEQTAQQINVYEEWDPLFYAICNIQQGSSEYISEIKVTLIKNQYGLYEMISEFNHECYCNKKDLYDCVSEILSNCLLNGK